MAAPNILASKVSKASLAGLRKHLGPSPNDVLSQPADPQNGSPGLTDAEQHEFHEYWDAGWPKHNTVGDVLKWLYGHIPDDAERQHFTETGSTYADDAKYGS